MPHPQFDPNTPLSRRDMLRRCGTGLGALGLAGLLADTAIADVPASSSLEPRMPHFAPRAKRMIHIFANGGDRNEKDAANPKSSLYKDLKMCKKLGIRMVFNVGKGGKIRSSSDLLRDYKRK